VAVTATIGHSGKGVKYPQIYYFTGIVRIIPEEIVKQGVNPKMVPESLGHAIIQITLDTYSHVAL
jgi:hypothetical protein